MEKELIEVAIRALTAEIEQNPQDAHLLKERGRLHMMAGEKDLAMRDLMAAAAIDPHLLDDMNGHFHAEKAIKKAISFAVCKEIANFAVQLKANKE